MLRRRNGAKKITNGWVVHRAIHQLHNLDVLDAAFYQTSSLNTAGEVIGGARKNVPDRAW